MCSRTLLGAGYPPHYLLHVVLHGKGEFFYQEKSMSFLPAMLFNRTDADPLLSGRQRRALGICLGWIRRKLRGRGSLLHNFPIFPCLYHGLCSVYSAHDPAECLFLLPKESTGTGICFLRLLSCMTVWTLPVEMITMNSIISRHWNISAIITPIILRFRI